MKMLYLLLLALVIPYIGFCQDTIMVKKSILFSGKNKCKSFGKGINTIYGREDIIYSDTHKRVEYCCYEDGKRNCFRKDYYIINDSTLITNDSIEIWYFKKINENLYSVYNQTDFYRTSGYAKSLIPLIFSSDLVAISEKTKDTLWTENYMYTNKRPEGIRIVLPYYAKLSSKLYEYYEVDTQPILAEVDSILSINVGAFWYCYNEPSHKNITLMSFIVNEDGKITGIEQAIGNFDMEYCNAEAYKEIALKISCLGAFKPAYKNGVPVAVRWFIKVEVENLPPNVKDHPAFEDSEENRSRYIQRKLTNK